MENNPALISLFRKNEHEAIAYAAQRAVLKTERLGLTFGDLQSQELPARKEIIRGLARGEVGMVNAVTNGFKSTLVRNVALSLTSGRPFPPITSGGSPMRCLLIDSEDTLVFLRDDLNKMTQLLSAEEKKLVSKNLLIMCEVLIDDEDLQINREDHFERIVGEAKRHEVELVVVDTISRSFVLSRENDNSEVKEKVMKPLKRIAALADAAVWAVHHIGKARVEEGASREPAHRGRGASSFADQSRVIFNLERDDVNDRVVLSCPKIKGPGLPSFNFRPNPQTRWLELENEIRLVSNYEELDGRVSERAAKANLTLGVERGDLEKVKQGHYRKAKLLPGLDESAEVQST